MTTLQLKTLHIESLMSFPVANTSHMLSLIAGGAEHGLWDSTEKGLLGACVLFPADSTPCAFLFTNFALYPFAMKSTDCEPTIC